MDTCPFRSASACATRLVADLGIVALMLAVASIPLTVAYGALADHQSLKVEWAINGPPVRSRPSRAFHRKPQAFSYQGVRFTRQYGNVICVVVPDDGPSQARHHRPASSAHRRRITVDHRRPHIPLRTGHRRAATVTIRGGRRSA
jgi:hypothetical protein